MSRHVLIAGCGYVGRATAAVLAARGDQVWALARQPRELPASVRPLAADLTAPESFPTLPTDFDYVLFAASAGEASDEAYRRVYVEGQRNLLRWVAASSALQRVFFTSSTAVYGQIDGSWVDEDSSTQPQTFSGRRTLEAESVLSHSGLPGTSLRCAGIYGPGRTRLIDGVRTGALRLPPESHFTNRIHRDDIAGAVAHLIAERCSEELLLLCDGDPARYDEVLRFLAERLGCPMPLQAEPGTTRRRGGNKRCRNSRLLSLGYRPRYPSFRDGYGEMLSV